MIVDAHNHIWDVPWPPLTPDVLAGQVERFLHHMDENGVQYAIVVAHLDEHDPENNTRALVHAKEKSDRFRVLANVHLNKPDAMDKLNELLGAPGLVGVSYYLSGEDNCEWMEPGPLWDKILEHGLAVNLNLHPHQHDKLRELATAYLETPFLVCHLGGPTIRGEPNSNWPNILRSAEVGNIYMKISGFAYYSKRNWEYPYDDVLPYIEKIAEAFGAERMLWGSDYPPTMRYMTYRQSLEVVRTHCTFLTEEERALVLGGNAQRLFNLD